MANEEEIILPSVPSHESIHNVWKAAFLRPELWEDIDLNFGPGRLRKPNHQLQEEICRRKLLEQDLITTIKKLGGKVTKTSNDNYIIEAFLLSESAKDAFLCILDQNQIDLRVLEHDYECDQARQRGPRRQIPRFLAGYIMSGLSLHQRLDSSKSGYEMMCEFFKKGGEFDTWFHQNVDNPFMDPTEWLATPRGATISDWAKAIKLECRRAFESWGEGKILKTNEKPAEREKILGMVERHTEKLWGQIVAKPQD